MVLYLVLGFKGLSLKRRACLAQLFNLWFESLIVGVGDIPKAEGASNANTISRLEV